MAVDGNTGMVAVVRGLQDAGLAVTLYDKGKEFTLAPNSFTNSQSVQQHGRNHTLGPINVNHDHSPHHSPWHRPYPNVPTYTPDYRPPGYPELKSTATDAMFSGVSSNNTGTQVVDGRYASVYQATYCRMKPSNPQPQLTEFPPQRAEGSRGGGNFVVGGSGSGDTKHRSIQVPNNYRGGGMIWPDKASVCSPRPSVQPDAFANSLRRYPRLSAERSSEIVERLITYTQAKNYGRSPTRQTSREQYEPVDDRMPKVKISRGCESPCMYDESPTRDRPKRGDLEPIEYKKFYKNYEVRQIKDEQKSMKDNPSIASCSKHQYQHSQPSSTSRQRSPSPKICGPQQKYPSMVHSEIQAAVTMVCRQVETVPRIVPSQRNVKVLCPDEDTVESKVCPSCQTQIQTTLSTIEIPSQRLVLNTRKSRSTEEIGNKYDNQIDTTEKLNTIFNTEKIKHTDIRNKKSNFIKINNFDDLSEACVRSNRSLVKHRNNRTHRRKVAKDFYNKSFQSRTYDIYRADISMYPPKDNIIRIVKSWLTRIPLKSHDSLGRLVKKDQILCFIVRRIKMIPTRVQIDKKRFRAEILDIVDDVPFDMGRGNRNIYLKKISEDLITKLELTKITSVRTNRSKRYFNNKYVVNTASNLKRVVRPAEEEIRKFVKNELIDAIHKSHLDINTCKARDVEDELVDVLNETLEDFDIDKDRDVTEEIVTTLEDIGQILRFQASYFATMLLNNFKKKFLFRQFVNEVDYAQNSKINNAANYLISQRNCGTSHIKVDVANRCCETSFLNITERVQDRYDDESQTELYAYTQQLSMKINQWLDTVQINIPQLRKSLFRETIINDLVKDIVDRQKYLKLNLNSTGGEKDEIEHLRYQIFKWMYKLAGDNPSSILESAPTLMKIVKNVSVPDSKKGKKNWKQNFDETSLLENLHQTNNENAIKKSSQVFTMTTKLPVLGGNNLMNENEGDQPDVVFTYTRKQNSTIPSTLAVQNTVGRTTPAPSDTSTSAQSLPPPQVKSIEQLNNEFIDFCKQWVVSIPIPPDMPQELEIRQGFLQGLIQAIAKIKSSPVIAINPLYYEDALDDEIEKLFSLLPQTEELLAKKHQLKVKMITKNCYMNEKIKQTLAPETFGQHVRDELSVLIPRTETNEREDDKVRLYEELKILFLAEEYILFLRFRQEDEMTANVYKMKLLRRIQEFVRDLKQIHNKELKNIDEQAYINDILSAMQNVPLPSDETIKQEADEVMLGMEIDKWFSDLPLEANDSVIEQFRRRRLRDGLAKKIFEMEQNISIADESGEQAVRHEVSQVLGKLPLQKDEDLKINFLVDELTNRIKNRQRVPTGRKKSVGFHEAIAYGDFDGQIATSASRNNVANPVYVGNTGQGQPQQTSGSARWVNVPGTPMAVDEKQTMKDPEGRMWFTFDSRPSPALQQEQLTHHSLPSTSAAPQIQPTPNAAPQSLQGINLAGAAYAKTKGPPQPILQPGMPLHLPIANRPQPYIPAQSHEQSSSLGFGNYQGHSQFNKPDGGHSLWLNKAVEDYEAKHPSLTAIEQSLQFAPHRPNVIHDLSQTSNQPVASSSLYQPQTSQSAQNGRNLPDPRQERQNGNVNTDGGWPYMLAHPFASSQKSSSKPQENAVPMQNVPGVMNQIPPQQKNIAQQNMSKQQASLDQSILRKMEPEATGVEKVGPNTKIEYISLPEGSMPVMVGPQPQVTSQPPSYLRSVQTSNLPPQPQNIAQQHMSKQQESLDQSVLRRMEPNVTMMDNVELGTEIEYISLPEGSMPVSMRPQPQALSQPPSYLRSVQMPNPQPNIPQLVPVQARVPYQRQFHTSQIPGSSHAPPAIPLQQASVPYSSPANQSIKGISGEAGRGPPAQEAAGTLWLSKYLKDYESAHPPLNDNPPGPGSIQVPPQNISPLAPTDYGLFDQEHPLASSMHQQLEQSLGGPAFQRSVGAQHPYSFSGGFVRGGGVNTSQPGEPGSNARKSVQIQTPMLRPMQSEPPIQKQPPMQGLTSMQDQSSRSSQQAERSKTLADNSPLTSAGLQVPDFYKSTDREGIQRFTNQNKSAKQPTGQLPLPPSSPGSQYFQSPGTQQNVRTVSAQTSNVQRASEEQQTSGIFSMPDRLSPPMAERMYRPVNQVKTGAAYIPPPPPLPPRPVPFAKIYAPQGPPLAYSTPATSFVPQGAHVPPPPPPPPPSLSGQPTGYPTQEAVPGQMEAPQVRDDQRRPNDDTGDDSDGRCRCLERMKKMKKLGLCRKCNRDFMYPMRYFPPCPWYF